MKIFNGKKVANKILEELKEDIKSLRLRPSLAVVFVGESEESKLYISLKKKAAEKIGIEVKIYQFSGQTKEEEVINKIKSLNEDENTSGIIVQLPLPATLSIDKIIGAIDPIKDVDGFHEINRKLLEKGEPRLMPILPMAILLALRNALKKDLEKKKILALVHSKIFGQTLKMVLEKEGANIDYLVRNTCIVLGIEKELKSADVLISVCGCPRIIKAESIKDNAILIDGGITRYHDGKVVGDIDRESVKGKASFLTPVPGGIGPLTVALLLRNVYLAAKNN